MPTLSDIDKLSQLREFCKHARHCEADRPISNFIVRNMLKSVLISNSFLLMIYMSRFKNYRNSYLGLGHIFATAVGLHNGIKGVYPIFVAY